VCWTHDRQWRGRTGPCTFQREHAWRRTFKLAGFEIMSERPLSRWRNLAHPVARRFFVLQATDQDERLLKRDYAAFPQLLDHAQAVSLAKGAD
jgi:hypothetical protein